MVRLTTIIFDMDGVLADTEPIHASATVRLLAAHGVEYHPTHEDNFFGLSDQEVFERLRVRYGLAASEASLAATWADLVLEGLADGLTPLPGVPGVLETLRGQGWTLGLASGSSPAVIASTLAALALGGSFDCVVSAKDVGRGKPAPDVFLEAARRLGVQPAACVVVEDSRNGVLAARSAGMRCAAIPCGQTGLQDLSGADRQLASLLELPAWLDTLRKAAGRVGLRSDGGSW